jgi:hypothetical protein
MPALKRQESGRWQVPLSAELASTELSLTAYNSVN